MGLFKNKKNEIPQPNSEEVQYRRYQHYYQEPVQPRKRKRISKLFGLVTILIILSIVFYLAVMYMWSRTSDVDDLVKIEDKQSYVQVEDMPDYTKNAFVAVEDKRFYDHDGIDLRGVSRALAVSLKNGELTQGGSTITQQVVKNYFYTNETQLTRKVKEMFVAKRVEDKYSKNDILSYYVNNIYFGQNNYTIEEAANYYFGATVDKNNPNLPQVTVLQSAILASVVNAPSNFDINNISDSYMTRIKTTLEKMKQQNYITESEYTEAINELNQ
ncbi:MULTISPECIES: monofunctional peptidoglycan glycosyltransferase SgtB [Mammaliicoccus]|uniref:monofunctional peptidoglycan glycosyltransferase SgtB n=1 Tax=Mammaliicoccus TaxID=2803850 RepID=UPI0009C1E735|nr:MULTISPECIES: monofunctional peptidoglycan glycosyltransferase SgtB [Mammaliicoccus]ARB40363.1 glycosyltransferase [Mammaliicoccus sciuri]MCE4979531.1 monofunctional peptidoglycan glycosyltransferase SgtB [Mammaliicoccus sciuri]MCE5057001.1 monofunctional peptidoglycan glycosyltransferase SgtB [Mammaliicoccus sciuri]MCE5084324.1 monofunctional peptidoglycan glycosyltransferase SgtB [Mammaliicoccus sciuri]MCE5095718.1 monofunctional peptidoglycan glycosyltransferase SgtB [Mammaliicoccus sciu